jgi:conjugative transfer region protein (TIGR03750 family)
MSPHDNVLANRLNAEPAIFKGCSSSELGVIATVATVVWFPVSLLLAWLLGAPSMGLGLAGITIVATVVIAARGFERLKRGRPDGYYQQRLIIQWSAWGLRQSPFVLRNGHWSVGRQCSITRNRRATLSLRD